MKKIKLFILIFCVLIASVSFAANPSKEINNKCRQNLKILNNAMKQMLEKKDYNLPKWSSYQQVLNQFLDFEKFMEGKKIVGPTPDCTYFLVNLGKGEWQWLCYLHGVLEGDENYSLKYHEYQLQGKANKKYMNNEEYKKQVQNMLSWTEYTLTPVEFFKYHYNMNPIITTILTVGLFIGSFLLLKSFFKF